MADVDAEIKGFSKLMRTLDKMQRDLPRETVGAAKDVAGDWISAARNKASNSYAQEAAQGLSVGTERDGSRITNSSPIFYGMEFGGRGRPETMQFPPHQGQRGYFFYPAARANTGNFDRIWEAAIDDATKSWDNKE